MVWLVEKLDKYNLAKPKDYWLTRTWGTLSLVRQQPLPAEWTLGSNRKFYFECSRCLRSHYRHFNRVSLRPNPRCGQCDRQPKAFWLEQTWGSLKLVDCSNLPEDWKAGTYAVFLFQCNCGRQTSTKFVKVSSGNTKSCGRCRYKSKVYWLQQTWGTLRLDPNSEMPEEWGLGSGKIFHFLCACGNTYVAPFATVGQKHSTTCARCNKKPRAYWLQQGWGQLTLNPQQNLPQNWSHGTDEKFLFNCSCGNSLPILFRDVFYGKTNSCGCARLGQGEFSKENEIRQFVMSLADDTSSMPYPIPGSRCSYDVYVPSKKLAVEHHGLIWHSEKYEANPRDYRKYQLARSRGDRLIQIYQDEWRDKRGIMEAQLREILHPAPKKRIQPQFEVALGKTPPPARAFLDRHHYLGAAGGCLTVMAKHKGEIVGVWVFMKRETGVVLWHRACWDHRYKAWNPHEKALRTALPLLKDMGFERIVTFADNRFHTGELYEKLGFTLEKELKPDYSYTDGKRRISKYALRVKAGTDEKSQAEAQGWYRIWDSGKKRYTKTILP